MELTVIAFTKISVKMNKQRKLIYKIKACFP